MNRPGSDEVYFDAANTQEELRPAPIVRYHNGTARLPADVLLLFLVGGGALFRFGLTRPLRLRRVRPVYYD